MNLNQQLEQAEQSWDRTGTRLILFWQIIIYATTGLSFVEVWNEQPELLQGWSLVLVAGLVLAYLLLFHLVLMNPRFWPVSMRVGTVYIVVQIVIVGCLSFWTRSFAGLGFALIAQIVGILPPRFWAYPVLIVVLMLGYSWGMYDNFPNGNWLAIGGFLFNIALFTGMFMSIELVSRQRERMKSLVDEVQQARDAAEALATQNAQLAAARQQTIGELETTRRELATAEREAGVLEERQRLARDIHDTLAQNFTSIVMHLEAAEAGLPAEAGSARQHVEQARRSAREGLSESRRLVGALRPELLEGASLPEALGRLAQQWSGASGVAATATVTGTVRPLPPQLEVTLLRVAQEALANVRKHAQASNVTLTLSFMDDELILDVQDDGVGFDPNQPHRSNGQNGGYGLTSMRERVGQLGGTLSVESAPGEGTTVVVEVGTA
ncbi:MAG: sensor histidine kinase [Chloroflexaceae bacterium]|jgi:signal transduction histidine kinase|nr:sensor histidine kinase [Chloroflexaceae bacterium]